MKNLMFKMFVTLAATTLMLSVSAAGTPKLKMPSVVINPVQEAIIEGGATLDTVTAAVTAIKDDTNSLDDTKLTAFGFFAKMPINWQKSLLLEPFQKALVTFAAVNGMNELLKANKDKSIAVFSAAITIAAVKEKVAGLAAAVEAKKIFAADTFVTAVGSHPVVVSVCELVEKGSGFDAAARQVREALDRAQAEKDTWGATISGYAAKAVEKGVSIATALAGLVGSITFDPGLMDNAEGVEAP